ncbi:MAG: hypothetical protein CSA62_04620 [Planctomycetota bacterium]|nr:MAG: hypothetical protein CSA62_04620 [Planctomycetota bacterium]
MLQLLFVLAVLFGLSGCASDHSGADASAEATETTEASWPEGSLVHLCSCSRELPARWRDAEWLLRLRQHVNQGGSLLLEGHAVQLAVALGLTAPGSVERRVLRRGQDGRSDAAGTRFGLAPAPIAEQVLGFGPKAVYFDSSPLLRVEYLALDYLQLRGGVALGFLAIDERGIERARSDCLLAGWELGKGRVLSFGLVSAQGEAHREPAEQWLAAKGQAWLTRGRELAVCREDGAPPRPAIDAWGPVPKAPARPPLYLEGPRPSRPWQLGVAIPGALLQQWNRAKLAEHLAAHRIDLVLLGVTGLDRLLDPVKASGLRVQADDVSEETLLDFAASAHDQGMQVALELPDGGGRLQPGEEQLAFVDALASRFFDEEKLGREAFDGLVLGGFDRWTMRAALASLQQQRPSIFVVSREGEAAPSDAVIGQIEPQAGRFAGLAISGHDAASLRRAYRPGVHGLLRLDSAAAHGASPDWLRQQCKDFVRLFGDRAHAIVLDLENPERLTEMLQLCSLASAPLAEAAVYRLASTGRGGARDALGQLLPSPALGAQSPAAAATTVLENRWLRLELGGGRLLFDPKRSGDFGRSALVLSPGFDRSRILGARPGPGYLLEYDSDFQPGSNKREARGTLLLSKDEPRWPGALRRGGIETLRQELELPRGRYQLLLEGQPGAEGAVLELALESAVLGNLVGKKARVEKSFEFSIAEQRPCELQLRLRAGARVELLRAELHRIGDVGQEQKFQETAGPLVELKEWVTTSFLREERELRMLGDLPGFLISVRYHKANNGLRVERSFALPGYRLLAAARSRGRAPWILEGTRKGLPRLWIYELGQGPKHRSLWIPGRGLRLRNAPRSHTGFRLAVLLADEFGPSCDPVALTHELRMLFDPPTLRLQAGRAELPASLPHPWPRLLKVSAQEAQALRVQDPLGVRNLRSVARRDGGAFATVMQWPQERMALWLRQPGEPAVSPGSKRILRLASQAESRIVLRRHALTPFSLRASVRFEGNLPELSFAGESWLYRGMHELVAPYLLGDLAFTAGSHRWNGIRLLDSSAGITRCGLDAHSWEIATSELPLGTAARMLYARVLAWDGAWGPRLRPLGRRGGRSSSMLVRGRRESWSLPRSAQPARPWR